MKPAILVAGLVAAVALAAGIIGYHTECDPALHLAARDGDTMAWLRREFHLGDRQFAEIERMHREYAITCDTHCRAIRSALEERAALRAEEPRDEHALVALDERLRAVEAECERALLRHLEQVAAVMSPEDGWCYLETMRPLVAKFDHSAAPRLDLSPQHPRESGR